MTDLRDILPAAESDAELSTHGRGPDGERVALVVDATCVRLGETELPLDDGLQATLAWAETRRGEDAQLRLELRSVVSATERRMLALVAPLDGLPPAFRTVELIRQDRGDALEVDGDTLLRVVARVRAVLEASAGTAAWQPRGELAVRLPTPAFVPLTEADLAPQDDESTATALRLLASGPTGSTVCPPFDFAAGLELLGATITGLVGSVFYVVGAAIATMFVALIVFDYNSPTLFLGVMVAAFAVSMWRAARALRRGLRIEPDALHLPGRHMALARRDVAEVVARSGAIEVIAHDGATHTAKCGANGAHLVRLIETAWGWRSRE